MKKKAERYWDKRAGGFGRPGEEDENPDPLVERTQKYLQPDHDVLVFACATGTRAFKFAPHARTAHGIDISSKMIGIAMEALAKSGIQEPSF